MLIDKGTTLLLLKSLTKYSSRFMLPPVVYDGIVCFPITMVFSDRTFDYLENRDKRAGKINALKINAK